MVLITAGALGGCQSSISSPDGSFSVIGGGNDSSATDSSTESSSESPVEGSTESSSESSVSEPAEPTATPINTEPDYEWDKVIALTFDDGPNIETTNEVLDVLEKHQVVASFFLIGNNITDDSAKSVKRAYDLGCEINNHSKSHGYMDKMTAEEIIEEYSYVDDKVFEITGEHTKFFRPPYIAVGDLMWENIDVPFISGLGCNDWDPNVTVEQRVKIITRSAQDGAIILMHDAQGNSQTVEAIDQIIPALKEQGYKFTTVSGLFEAKGITPVTKMIYSNAAQQGMWG
ncbi:MAG: polysaccharide deacetylase family protein [Ruminococcaceae bacterium]|nr:polysaccharide deacetylase family protein [Oscillospiraceae bacterium]